MATRSEIEAAVRAADERTQALRERVNAAPEAPLAEGDWRVRDALSHLAARADLMPLIERVRAQAASEDEPAAFDVDAMNAEQIAERSAKTAGQIIDEIHANYTTALSDIAALSDATLAQPVKLPMMPNEIELSDLVLMSVARHVSTHLDEIESALAD